MASHFSKPLQYLRLEEGKNYELDVKDVTTIARLKEVHVSNDNWQRHCVVTATFVILERELVNVKGTV